MVSENRRKDFRVNITLHARWKRLTEQELEILKSGKGQSLLTQTEITSPIEDILQQTQPGSKEENLYRSLQMINNKLDFIIEQMLTSPSESLFRRDKVIELSGSGFKLVLKEELSPGTFIRVHLLIPGIFQYLVELIAEILRIEKCPDGLIAAARIVEIDETGRDAIINVVFKKHRREIRMQKTKKEEIIGH
ncbi:MAG: PilZ domain-containing protein [Deltaproteobacteria bacterium]|nr:PilZ domain-containing protein [Deltaproteobacteria bacterium]